MSLDHWAAYIKERENKETYSCPEGFLTYRITGPECYIIDLWTHPDHRKSGVASRLADKVAEIAKEKGCTYLVGSVATAANGSTASLKVLLAYGFNLAKSDTNMIFLIKELQ